MKVKNHMQAFPFLEPHEDDNIKAYHPGMTMRDEFAKAAMQAIMVDFEEQKYWGTEYGIQEMLTFTAERAYEQADAMMKARK